MAVQCPACGGESNSPYVCTSCGDIIPPPTATGMRKVAGARTPTDPRFEKLKRSPDLGRLKHDPLRRRGPGPVGRIVMALVLIGIGGAMYVVAVRDREPVTRHHWNEDTQVSEVLYAVMTDKRYDLHAVCVACREASEWTVRTAKLVRGPVAPLAAREAHTHWEAVDDALDTLRTKTDGTPAGDVAANCAELSRKVGVYLQDVTDGKVQADKSMDELANGLLRAAMVNENGQSTAPKPDQPRVAPAPLPIVGEAEKPETQHRSRRSREPGELFISVKHESAAEPASGKSP